MKSEILNHINDPQNLEKLYRGNKALFKKEFNIVYPQIKQHAIAEFWHERLNHETAEISWGSSQELTFIILASCLAGVISKLPGAIGVKEEFYYPRNIAFIVFPLLMLYFSWKNKVNQFKLMGVSIAVLLAIIYINLLPDNLKSDTLILACIHLPLFLWALLGLIFVGNDFSNQQKRLDYLKYNGDLIVITTLILISGGILTGITIGLFSVIGLQIHEFYFEYVVVFGLSAAPIVGTYVVQNNPQLVNKVSPLIAKLFSPIVLFTLIIYLVAIIISGKDPYKDREFLITFNALLIGVMAIILFSVAGTSRSEKGTNAIVVLFSLSFVTIIVNSIALSAILFRISEWGITANRLAVLGGNILILINLIMVCFRLFKAIKSRDEIESVEKAISSFLPTYAVWTMIVTFIFPFVFKFR